MNAGIIIAAIGFIVIGGYVVGSIAGHWIGRDFIEAENQSENERR